MLPTPTKVDANLVTDTNGSESNIECTDSYDYIIGMILYLESNTIPDISFVVHQCAWCTHNTKT